MLSFHSRGAASRSIRKNSPPASFLIANGLPSHARLEDMLLVEVEGEYFYKAEDLEKYLGIASFTENQVEAYLFCGHVNCPSCKADLAPPVVLLPGQRYEHYGFTDYDVDGPRWQKEQFACKKCRHQWGGICTGGKDANHVAIPVASKSSAPTELKPPKPDSLCGKAWAIFDEHYADPNRAQDWKTWRANAIAACVAAGQNEGNAGTEIPRWRKYNGAF